MVIPWVLRRIRSTLGYRTSGGSKPTGARGTVTILPAVNTLPVHRRLGSRDRLDGRMAHSNPVLNHPGRTPAPVAGRNDRLRGRGDSMAYRVAATDGRVAERRQSRLTCKYSCAIPAAAYSECIQPSRHPGQESVRRSRLKSSADQHGDGSSLRTLLAVQAAVGTSKVIMVSTIANADAVGRGGTPVFVASKAT
jgi:hypothetical protein